MGTDPAGDALDEALTVCGDVPAIGIYAGSGTLARQIEQGAPADIYISANPQWMNWLEQRGRVVSETRVDLLGNTLVLITASDTEGDLPTVPAIEKAPDKYRFAIGEIVDEAEEEHRARGQG